MGVEWFMLQRQLTERNFFNQIQKLMKEGRIDVENGVGWDRKISIRK